MTNIKTILNEIVSNIADYGTITNITESGTNIYTVSAQNIANINVGDYVSISGTTNFNTENSQVIAKDVNSFNLKYTGTFVDENSGTWTAKKPVLFVGTTRDTNNRRKNIKGNQMYPFFFIKENELIIKPFYVNTNLQSYYANDRFNFTLYLFDRTDPNENTDNIRSNSIMPLYDMLNKFIWKLKEKSINVTYTNIRQLIRYGNNSQYGYVGLPFDELISGLQAEIELTVEKGTYCFTNI